MSSCELILLFANFANAGAYDTDANAIISVETDVHNALVRAHAEVEKDKRLAVLVYVCEPGEGSDGFWKYGTVAYEDGYQHWEDTTPAPEPGIYFYSSSGDYIDEMDLGPIEIDLSPLDEEGGRDKQVPT